MFIKSLKNDYLRIIFPQIKVHLFSSNPLIFQKQSHLLTNENKDFVICINQGSIKEAEPPGDTHTHITCLYIKGFVTGIYPYTAEIAGYALSVRLLSLSLMSGLEVHRAGSHEGKMNIT